MTCDRDERDSGFYEPEWERVERERRRFRIPDVATVRVCDRIEPEHDRFEHLKGYQTVEKRYAALTGPLPLRGAAAMTRDRSGVVRLVAAMTSAAPWMGDVAAVVEEQVELALWAGSPWLRLRPLLIVGGPGSGKSHFARALAEVSGCALMQLPLGGDNDNRSLGGTARGWTGAQPALPIVGMAQGGTANPVVVLDELDKVSPDRRHGNAWDTLLSMLEPVTADTWYDRCLMAAVDLRHVVWIATANDLHPLPPPLLSRFDVVRVTGPGPAHVPGLLSRFRLEWAERNGVAPATMPALTAAAEALLVDHYGRTRSLRQLRRGLELALREAIRTAPRTLQ